MRTARKKWAPFERTYVVKEKDAEKPVEIPTFCTVAAARPVRLLRGTRHLAQTVKCWRWDKQYNYTGGTWPGVDCKLLGTAANGNKVWKWTYSGSLTTRPTGIIFNDNGSPQTADLAFVNGAYYDKDGQKGIVTGITTIRESATKQVLYDLQGRRIGNGATSFKGALSPGIYVRQGRTVVVR